VALSKAFIIFGLIAGIPVLASAQTATPPTTTTAPKQADTTADQRNGQNRRDTRQDCRGQEGAVGADKRDCKQAGR
jgi:hypothetical protein